MNVTFFLPMPEYYYKFNLLIIIIHAMNQRTGNAPVMSSPTKRAIRDFIHSESS